MPTIPPLPQALLPVLPFITLIITDWLKHSKLARWINVLIGLVVPLFLATIWALLSNALTPDLSADIVILAALCYAVMALPDIAPLRDWLQATLVSPLALVASPPEPEPEPEPAIKATTVPTAPTPHGIDLRSSAVPPSRKPQFVDPSPSLHSRPIVQITVPSQPTAQSPHTTAPMPATTPETPEPVEEQAEPTEQS